MNNDFLSQEKMDSVLNDVQDLNTTNKKEQVELLNDVEKDLLGEIGNISMGAASTALSTLLNQSVNITTPKVSTTTLKKLKETFQVPNISVEVKFTRGIIGENLLVMKVSDAAVVSSLMMGGDSNISKDVQGLSEIEKSAVAEAMNQMIGSAATSMATMFSRQVSISPPSFKVWTDNSQSLAEGISEDEDIVKVEFRLNIGKLIDSKIMQVLPLTTAKEIVSIMTREKNINNVSNEVFDIKESVMEKAIETEKIEPQVEIKKAAFEPLSNTEIQFIPNNIDLILDVPLDISVVLGKKKMTIKDILNLGIGSLIQLDKLAEEPVEILVNGKTVAYGEVVVVDENFGVRITNIVSNIERVKSLAK